MSVPDPFNAYHEMKHNSLVTRQNQLEFWDQAVKMISHTALKISVLQLIAAIKEQQQPSIKEQQQPL